MDECNEYFSMIGLLLTLLALTLKIPLYLSIVSKYENCEKYGNE